MTRDSATSRASANTGCLDGVSISAGTTVAGTGASSPGQVTGSSSAWSLSAALLGFFV